MMTIHVRLRPGQDDEIATWYDTQQDKSRAVREAIRAYIKAQSGDHLETIVQHVVARELAGLPTLVSAAVREALESYHFARVGAGHHSASDENPELASRLDEQIDTFFD
jgi:hypothetical protein